MATLHMSSSVKIAQLLTHPPPKGNRSFAILGDVNMRDIKQKPNHCFVLNTTETASVITLCGLLAQTKLQQNNIIICFIVQGGSK